MKVLVLGGTGLISQSIVRQLVGRGDDVHVYNRGLGRGFTSKCQPPPWRARPTGLFPGRDNCTRL